MLENNENKSKEISVKPMNNYFILEKYNMAIVLDTSNEMLLDYSHKNKEIDISSEGILKAVNAEISESIENHFKIELSDYGVEIYDESITMEMR